MGFFRLQFVLWLVLYQIVCECFTRRIIICIFMKNGVSMFEDFYCMKVITMSINSHMNTHQEAYPRLTITRSVIG